MLKPAPIGLSIALLFCHPVPEAEAALNKCTDGRQITYTTDPCETTGLRSAGPIKDAVTIMPLIPKPQKGSTEKPGKGSDVHDAPKNVPPREGDTDAGVSREVTIRPVSPLVNKMLNW